MPIGRRDGASRLRPARSGPARAGSQAATVSLPRALSKRAVCSRREGERLVRAGRVRVNGRTVRDPSARVRVDEDLIEIDGSPTSRKRQRIVIALHKPVGYITTRSDPGHRPTVYGLLAGLERWVFPVGRLDRDTSGLLILTDDHVLGQRLTDPAHEVVKVYHARIRGVPSREELHVLRQGVPLREGIVTRPAGVRPLGVVQDGSSWIELRLREGRNRQVRRMCAAIGHDVLDLVRVRIGRLELGDLRSGEWRRLVPREVARLMQGPRSEGSGARAAKRK